MVTKNGDELVVGFILKYTASLNTGDHAVDTLTGLLIDLNDNFDIVNTILMDMYIRDWKATSRNLRWVEKQYV